MKKRIVGILACLMVASSAAAVGGCAANCGGGEGNKDPGGETPPIIETEDNYKIVLQDSFTRTLDIDEESELRWTVTNNNELVTDKEVVISIVGDAISFDKETNKVKGEKTGKATLTISLLDEEGTSLATPVEVNFNVYEYFFSHSYVRGEVNFNSENAEVPKVSLNGDQSCVVAKKQGTKFVFRCTVTNFDQGDFTETFAIASVSDIQDKQLWIGAKGVKPTQGIYDVYLRNWYDGWGGAIADRTVDGYGAVNMGEMVSGGRAIEFELIRDGADYYFSVDGYWGKYTDTSSIGADTPTYPGIFSQNRVLQLTDFSVAYDDESVAAAVAGYAEKSAAAVAIDGDKVMLVKGESYTFTAATYPLGAPAAGEIVWSLDKSQMTAGLEGTTIEGGKLQLDGEAAGIVTIVATIEGTGISTRRNVIIIDNAVQENEQIIAKGGVQLDNETGAITFLDIFKDINGIGGDESLFIESDYCAMLKQLVKTNFSIEFTVSGYESTAAYPKLQIGLGSQHNNFYIAYYSNGDCRIEARVRAMNNGAFADGWYNSNDLKGVAGFDRYGSNTFKIMLTEDGTYKVFVNGEELTFTTGDGTEVILKRDFLSFDASLPIKIATNGVAAVVSDIVVTDGTEIEYPDYWYYNGTNIVVEEGDVTFTLADGSWSNRDRYLTRVTVTEALPENYVIEYDVQFSNRNTDAKLVLMIGGWQYIIVNKLNQGGVFAGQIERGGNWGSEVIALAEIPTFAHVRLERNGNSIRFIVNDVVIEEFDNVPVGKFMEFYAFNETAADAERTVKLSNLTVSEYSKIDVYQVEVDTETSLTDLDEADATPINVTVKLNGAVSDNSNYTIEYELDDDEAATLDTSSDVATIKGLKEGEVVLTISVYKGEGEDRVLIKTLTVTYVIEHVLVENDYVTVKGGVKLEVNGDDPMDTTSEDYTIIFTEEKGFTNGIGNEQAWEDNAYSANLKQKVQGDFSIEFTVSDYVAVSNGPKLMLSLGGTHNQFFLCYYPESGAAFDRDGIARFETFVDTVDGDYKYWNQGGDWGETANFADSGAFHTFDKSGSVTYKIAVENGIYHIYMKVDGEFQELTHYSNNGTRTFARKYEEYISELPIRFSTNGAAVKVSNIKVTQEGIKDYWFANNHNVHVYDEATDGADEFDFRLTAAQNSWEGRDRYTNRIHSTEYLAANTTVEMTMKLSAGMGDGKVIIAVGGKEVMICPKSDGLFANINGCGADWNEGAHPISVSAADDGSYTFNVKIVRNNGNIALLVNDVSIHNLDNAGTDNGLWFAVFNERAEDANVIVTVSNLTVTNN